jgi:hypothetical protein
MWFKRDGHSRTPDGQGMPFQLGQHLHMAHVDTIKIAHGDSSALKGLLPGGRFP